MNTKNIIITIVISALVGVGAFYGGIKYAQSQRTAAFNGAQGNFRNGQSRNGTNGQRFMMQNGERPVMGEILSQDDKSITIKLQDGSTKIILLSDSTAINKAAQGTKTDLTQGARVLVVGKTNSDGSVTAQNIQLNPQTRMFGGPNQSATPSATPAQ